MFLRSARGDTTFINWSMGAGRIVLSDEESESQWQRNDYKETKNYRLLF